MPCEAITLPGGGRAIVCGRTRSRAPRCACGAPATRLCDWKTTASGRTTCDRPLCDGCSTRPARNKDLCPDHARAFEVWRTQPRLPLSSGERPDALPLTDHDAPAVPTAGVSAPIGRPVETALAAAKPETPQP